MVGYFRKYFDESGFRLADLINDDFIAPVRLLFNNRFYVSALKLLLVAIDTIGFIEFGDDDVRDNTFIKWLDTYSDLEALGITSKELWEHRNSLLHVSGPLSRRVRNGRERMLVLSVGDFPTDIDIDLANVGYFDFIALLNCVANACEAWLGSYVNDRDKIDLFCERYDQITSDARMLEVQYLEKEN